MIIGTVIYTLLETFLKLIESGCVWIANRILDDTITVFSADQNVFVTFINLIPFANTINLSAIIKGTAYGIAMMLMSISIPYYDLRVKTRSPSPFAWRPDFLAAPREAH